MGAEPGAQGAQRMAAPVFFGHGPFMSVEGCPAWQEEHAQPTRVPRRKCLLINAVGNNLLLVRNGKREDDTPAPCPWWGLSWAVSGRVVSCLTSSPGGAKPSGLLGCVAWVAHRFVAAFAFLSHVPALLPGTMEMLL